MKLTFVDTVKLAVNSLVEGLLEKQAAIDMIVDAAHNCSIDCREKVREDLRNTFTSLKRTIDEEVTNMMNDGYPLDKITVEEAERLHDDKGMILLCEDGHVMEIYRENRKGDVFYGKEQERACV